MYINDAECRAAGYSGDDIKKIKSIARRLSKAAEEASLLNIKVFGGSGGSSIGLGASIFLGGKGGGVGLADGSGLGVSAASSYGTSMKVF